MTAHAILSPSSASRWMACTPSARLEQTFPDTESEAAAEGTLAHKLAELTLMYRLKRIKRYVFEKKAAAIREDELYAPEMSEYVDAYADYVMEKFNEAKARTPDAQIFLETRLDLSEYVREGFGTLDVRIVADDLLIIIDLKYGRGVRVDAQENKQLRVYGIGALRDSEFIFDITELELTIYQPRLDSITTERIAAEDLRTWAEIELKPRADLAFDGDGEYIPGEHCRFCKAGGACKANAVKNLEVEEHAETPAHLLSPDDISDILDKADGLKKWLTAVESYALDQALNHGKEWPGYKVVRGKTKRTYSNEAAIVEALNKSGFIADEIAPRSLLSITNLEKKIGAQAFKDHATPHIYKPDGKPDLAPLSDRRPKYDRYAQAADDFA